MHQPGVLALFARQYWVASVRQLRELGVSRHSALRAVRSGVLERVMHGVIGVPGHCHSFESRCMTLQLVDRSRGFLSGTTAGRLYGLRRMPTEPVRYTVHESRFPHVPSWAFIARTSWLDEEDQPARPDGLIVASPFRMLFDLAATLSDRRFERAAEDAWHLGLVSPGTARAYLQRIRRQGRTGVARFEQWLEHVAAQSNPATTGLEQLLADLARDAGLPEPVRQHPLQLLSGAVIHLDLAWPEVRLALEPGHSWWHGGDAAQRADQDRDRECAEVGWQVLRYDESAWQRRRQIVGQLRRAYHVRSNDLARGA